jgi:hypothetical protein
MAAKTTHQRVSDFIYSQILLGRQFNIDLMLEIQKMEQQMITTAFSDGMVYESLNRPVKDHTDQAMEYYIQTYDGYDD